jgi:hypothetical protein
MLDPHQEHTDPGGVLFRDVLSLALLGFLAVIVLLLPHVDPKGVETASNAPAPGNVIVEITWPQDMNADVDLWVQAPGDIPVGYSNKGGVVFNLLRDDLGMYLDPTRINHETAYSRGIIAGEYVVNAHAYRVDRNNPPPIEVRAAVSVRSTEVLDDGSPFVAPLLGTTAELKQQGEEITLFRFQLAADGSVIPNSTHSIYKPLRTRDMK